MTSQRESFVHSPDGQLRKGQSYSYAEIWAPLDQTQSEVPGTFSPVGGEDLLSATEENNARLQNYQAWKEALAGSLPEEPEEEFWSSEPVMAWRAWRWTGSALRGVRAEWSSSELVAVCIECVELPGWNHTCGIYGLATPRRLYRQVPRPMQVYGRVELTGLVIEHELGYRASHARIIELFVDSPALARQIRTRYPDVTVHTSDPIWEAQKWPT